jgi:hypothetical protein
MTPDAPTILLMLAIRKRNQLYIYILMAVMTACWATILLVLCWGIQCNLFSWFSLLGIPIASMMFIGLLAKQNEQIDKVAR